MGCHVVPWLSSTLVHPAPPRPAPPPCWAVQVLLMSAVRLMSFFYIASFNKIVEKHLKAAPADTRTHTHSSS